MYVFFHKAYLKTFESRHRKIVREVAEMIYRGELARKLAAQQREQKATAALV